MSRFGILAQEKDPQERFRVHEQGIVALGHEVMYGDTFFYFAVPTTLKRPDTDRYRAYLKPGTDWRKDGDTIVANRIARVTGAYHNGVFEIRGGINTHRGGLAGAPAVDRHTSDMVADAVYRYSCPWAAA